MDGWGFYIPHLTAHTAFLRTDTQLLGQIIHTGRKQDSFPLLLPAVGIMGSGARSLSLCSVSLRCYPQLYPHPHAHPSPQATSFSPGTQVRDVLQPAAPFVRLVAGHTRLTREPGTIDKQDGRMPHTMSPATTGDWGGRWRDQIRGHLAVSATTETWIL